jgi:alkylation response protein AidB-like acyl-CoA dehydrogenase
MDFSLAEEQPELKAQAREVLAAGAPTWEGLAELGWLGVAIPEGLGGAGLTVVEETLLHEELGYALYDGPYLATVALALPALEPAQQQEVAAGTQRWSAEIAGLVPEWGRVDAVVTPDGTLAQPEGEALPSIDETRPLGRLNDASGGQPLSPHGLAALAAEAVGVAQWALDTAVEYAKTREQFGKPIGTYQAVSHPLATTYAETELARSLAYWAAWCVAEDDPQAPVAAAAANAYASEAAVAACERAIQAHGGIGFTWEHPLHRYYKRALWIEAFGARPHELRREIADRLVGAEEAAWTA